MVTTRIFSLKNNPKRCWSLKWKKPMVSFSQDIFECSKKLFEILFVSKKLKKKKLVFLYLYKKTAFCVLFNHVELTHVY